MSRISSISPDNLVLRAELTEFGWYESRCFPIQDWVQRLLVDDLVIFEAAEKFLVEFGGLRMRPRWWPGATFAIRTLHFDARLAGTGEADRVFGWESVLKERMYPIGEMDAMLLLISESGAIYLDSFGIGKKVGDTIENGLEQLLFRQNRMEIIDLNATP